LKSKLLNSHLLSTSSVSSISQAQLNGNDLLFSSMAPSALQQRMKLEEQLMKLNFDNNNNSLINNYTTMAGFSAHQQASTANSSNQQQFKINNNNQQQLNSSSLFTNGRDALNSFNTLSSLSSLNSLSSLSGSSNHHQQQQNNMFPYDLSFKSNKQLNKQQLLIDESKEEDEDDDGEETVETILDLSKTSSSHQYNKQKRDAQHKSTTNNSNTTIQSAIPNLSVYDRSLLDTYRRRYCNSTTSASRSSSSTSSSPTSFGVLDAYNAAAAVVANGALHHHSNGSNVAPSPFYNAICGALASSSSASSTGSLSGGDLSPTHPFDKFADNSMQCNSTVPTNASSLVSSLGQATDLSAYPQRVPVIQSLVANSSSSSSTKSSSSSSAISSSSSLTSRSISPNLNSSSSHSNGSIYLTEQQIENGQQLIQMCQQNAGLLATATIPKRYEEICSEVKRHLHDTLEKLIKRLGLPNSVVPTIEFVNGGHGIRNPLLAMNLKMHNQIPVNQNDPLRCTVCFKKFNLTRLLNRHLKCHSDMKRYLCTFCGKGFNDTFDLKRHTRTHTGVRPYKCNSCDKSFTQRCSLESHTLKVHNIQHDYAYKERRAKMYVCEECGNTTNQPDNHFNHLKTQHPYSLALSKFNDKRHFKFNEQDASSVLMQLHNQNSNSSTITNHSSSSSVEKMEK